MEPSLKLIKGILLLDNDGNRLLVKYYDDQYSTTKEQKAFEKSLFTKTHKANGEIIMLDNMTIVYKSSIDVFFYVFGSTNENEIILVSILNCLFESISQIVRKNLEKKYIFRYMDLILLAVDEICDDGILLEADANQIVQRVYLKSDNDIPFGEQTVFDVLKLAKNQLKTSVFK